MLKQLDEEDDAKKKLSLAEKKDIIIRSVARPIDPLKIEIFIAHWIGKKRIFQLILVAPGQLRSNLMSINMLNA